MPRSRTESRGRTKVAMKGGPRKKIGESEMWLMRNPMKFQRLVHEGWFYPNQPIKTNTYVPYRLLRATDLSSFWIELLDETHRNIERGVTKAIQKFMNVVLRENSTLHLPFDCLRMRMPVVVLNALKEFHRAEVFDLDETNQKVFVILVDSAKEMWVDVNEVFAPSTGLLRYPKLAIQCKLAKVVPPDEADTYPKFDYPSLLQGSKTSLLCPVSEAPGYDGIVEVLLECDGKDVALRAIVLFKLAVRVPLQSSFEKSENDRYTYPTNDFEPWIGMKLPIFGIRIRTPNQVALQLDPENVNNVIAAIEEYIKNTPDMDKKPFKKDVDTTCLARFQGGEWCRGTIIQVLDDEEFFFVKYIDYCDYAVVAPSEVAFIPEHIIEFPIGATLCAIAGLTTSKMDSEPMMQKLKDLIDNQNFFGRIEATEYISDNIKNTARTLVSLSLPLGEDADEVSFGRLLDIPEVPLDHKVLRIYPKMDNEVGRFLLDGNSDFSCNVKYSGVLSCVENEKSVWLQIEDNLTKTEELAKQMTDFYSLCKDFELYEHLAVPGAYVAVQHKDDPQWYRGKIIRFSKKCNLYEVLFLDFGNRGLVDLTKLKPLPVYFGYMPQLSLETALPVKFCEPIDLNRLSEFVLCFCEDGGCQMDVWFRHVYSLNYAWIVKKNGTSLATELIKNGFATDVLFPDMWNIRD